MPPFSRKPFVAADKPDQRRGKQQQDKRLAAQLRLFALENGGLFFVAVYGGLADAHFVEPAAVVADAGGLAGVAVGAGAAVFVNRLAVKVQVFRRAGSRL